MLLMIQHNPNQEDPNELFEKLKLETGASYLDYVEPDKEALTGLQELISPNMKKKVE